jgi:hypothetical protein
MVTATPDGDVTYHVVVDRRGATLRAGPVPRPDLTFTSDYGTAAAVARGDLSTQAALSLGRIRVAGNVARLADRAEALAGLDPLPPALRAVTTY